MDDSYLVVLAPTPPFIHITNRDFVPVAQWGTRGQGPGELTYPVDVCIRDSEIWVLNKLPHRMQIYRINGELLRSIPLDQAKFVVSMRASKNGVIVQDGGLYSSPNNLFSIAEGKMHLLESFDPGEVLTIEIPPGPSLSLIAPYSPRVFWDLMGPDTLLVYTPEAGITLRNSNLQVIGAWKPPARAYPVPEEARELWLDTNFASSSAFPGSSDWRRKAERTPMPQVFAQVLQLLIDGEKIWLLRAYQKDGQLWECYEGKRFIGTARFPFSANTHLIQDGLVLLSDPDQDMPLTIFELKRERP